MYTLMMMTALSTSPDAAQFNGFFRDLFNRDSKSAGCQGTSCQGNSCQGSTSAAASTSCQGSSCHSSCHGHGVFGIRDYFSRSSNSCNGGSCNGNTAARSSCQGSSCQGSSCLGSSYASCMGSSCFGSLPMGAIPYPMGGEYSQPYPISYASPMEMGAGCLGGGGMPMGNYNYPMIPSPSVPMVPSGPPMIMPSPEQAQPRAVPPENATLKLSDTNRATVVVKLPADAKLYAEGRPLNLSSAERKFTTPPLPGDRDAVYNFRIEYSRDGELVTQSKKVTVRAGSVAVLEFNDLLSKGVSKTAELYANNEPKLGAPVMPVSNPTPVAAPSIPATIPAPAPSPAPTILPPLGAGSVKPMPTDRAKITVKVPSGTVLFVDGKKNDRTDAVREFTTPTLTAGKLYTYVMRIERGAEKEERKIEFMAGEAHTVDFTAWPAGNQRASR